MDLDLFCLGLETSLRDGLQEAAGGRRDCERQPYAASLPLPGAERGCFFWGGKGGRGAGRLRREEPSCLVLVGLVMARLVGNLDDFYSGNHHQRTYCGWPQSCAT